MVHLVTLWADSYVEFGWREMLIPGASSWRPWAVAWGVLAAWILVAVEITSLLRSRIRPRVWRIVHWMSLLVVVLGTVHALQAGSDVDNLLVWVAAGIGSLAIIALGAVRLRGKDTTPDRPGQSKSESEILLEMRQRLADMPVPEARSRIELVTEATTELPQRSDDEAAPEDGHESGALLEALGRAVRAEHDVDPGLAGSPFPAEAYLDHETLAGESDQPAAAVGAWLATSPDDPFSPTNRTDGPAEPRPFVAEPQPSTEPASPAEPAAEIPPPAPTPLPIRPLRRVEPIQQPVEEPSTAAEAEPAPSPPPPPPPPPPPAPAAPTGTDAMVAVAPPPLPTAVDPETGEPDEEAYRAWLVEWLSYAEQYGDEAPTDPDRV